MKKLTIGFFQALTILLCLSVATNGQGNSFKDIRYQGGTVQTKIKPDEWGNRLTISSDEITPLRKVSLALSDLRQMLFQPML